MKCSWCPSTTPGKVVYLRGVIRRLELCPTCFEWLMTPPPRPPHPKFGDSPCPDAPTATPAVTSVDRSRRLPPDTALA
jgi:hypothetical protein